MSFTVPEFPVQCNIWRFDDYVALLPPTLSPNGNLAWGRRVFFFGIPQSGEYQFYHMTLLLPAGTDVRDEANYYPNAKSDVVEFPAGSHRFYTVVYVDDIGKGFPNEHRAAVLKKISDHGSPWPNPIP